MADWTFAQSIPPGRAAALLAATDIENIAHHIAAEMLVVCCHLQPCGDNTAFQRVAYCVTVSEDLFDLFFNSPHGYRGAYFRSPGQGLNGNAAFIRTLAPKLLAFSAAIIPEEAARQSLLSPSAKAWLAEKGLEMCEHCVGEWGPPGDNLPEIINGRWELAESGPQCLGRKAPRFKKIRVFGAFLDDRHDEFIPARKRFRAEDIHSFGWA